MKIMFFLCGLLLSVQLSAQTITASVNALEKGDVEGLAAIFDETIEIRINDVPDLYNIAEAKTKLKQFFTDNKPISFSKKHDGDSKGKDSQYVIGDLKTTGKNFRVYIYFQSINGKKKIQELRFDKN